MQNRVKYDYVLTDETMNYMRGSLLIQNLRALMNENIIYGMNIYMVTSYEKTSMVSMFGNIADGIITKPLTKDNVTNIFALG